MTGGRRGLTRGAIVAGVGSGVALCVLGNLDGAVQILEGLWKLGGNGVESGMPAITGLTRALVGLMALAFGAQRPGFDFWRSTRFIGPEEPGPIHEFPFFTFLYGDLHAHMLSMPLQVMAVAVGLQAVRLARSEIVAAAGLRVSSTRVAALRTMARPLALIALAGLLVGMLRATNTWELPTYLALAGLLTVIATRPGRWARWPVALAVGAVVLGAVYAASSIFFAPFLARYELFYSGVSPVRVPTAPSQFLLVNGALLFVVVSYLAYVSARSATVVRALTSTVGARVPAPASSYVSMLAPTISLAGDGQISPLATALLALGVILWAGGYGTLGILVLAGGVVAGLAVYRRASRELLFVAGIAAAALGSLALPEVVAVKGDVGRMNTVFKFYLQAWILLALLAGPSAVLVWRGLFRRDGGARGEGRGTSGGEPSLSSSAVREEEAPTPGSGALREEMAPTPSPSPVRGGGEDTFDGDEVRVNSLFAGRGGGETGVGRAADELVTRELVAGVWKYVWAGLLVFLVAACAVYPILATRTKVGLRFAQIGPGLDGMAFMEQAAYRDKDRDLDLPSDYRAIRWLMENVQGTPVIIEGYAPLYHWGSRVSIYTGLPTVLGWDWHQKQQRAAYGERVDQRLREVNRFYEHPDPEVAWGTIRKYGVSLIVVGGLERAYYPAAGLSKFDRMAGNGLEVVYRDGGVTIFAVAAP